MNGSLLLLLGVWVFAPWSGKNTKGGGAVSYVHTSLLPCSRADFYWRSVPLTDSSFVLSMLTQLRDK